jgi:hypothetical protein
VEWEGKQAYGQVVTGRSLLPSQRGDVEEGSAGSLRPLEVLNIIIPTGK